MSAQSPALAHTLKEGPRACYGLEPMTEIVWDRVKDKSMKKRLAILFMAALVSVFGVSACAQGAQEKVQEGKQKVEQKAQEAQQKAEQKAQKAQQKAQEGKQRVEQKAQEAQQKVEQKAHEAQHKAGE
jgi:uncharacterized protein HemX